jgi:hypothetical protein
LVWGGPVWGVGNGGGRGGGCMSSKWHTTPGATGYTNQRANGLLVVLVRQFKLDLDVEKRGGGGPTRVRNLTHGQG